MRKSIAAAVALSLIISPLSTARAAGEVTITWNVAGERSSESVPVGSTVDISKKAYKA